MDGDVNRVSHWGWFLLGDFSLMQADPRFLPPVNHVFVDVENVKKVELFVLDQKNYIVHLFFGPTNKKLEVDVVERMLMNSQAVKMIRSPKEGKDALDFVLAYHLGQEVLMDPKAYFHLLSRDEGFDSLVELLKARNVKVKRHSSWEELEASVVAKNAATSGNGQSGANGVVAVPVNGGPEKAPLLSHEAVKFLVNLIKSARNHPKKEATLVSHANSSLGKKASDTNGKKVVTELKNAGHLKIDDKGAVSYLW